MPIVLILLDFSSDLLNSFINFTTLLCLNLFDFDYPNCHITLVSLFFKDILSTSSFKVEENETIIKVLNRKKEHTMTEKEDI